MQWLGMEDPDWQQMILTLLGIVIGMVVLISLLLVLRYRAPQPDKAAVLYRTFIKKSRLPMSVGETPVAFAARAHSGSSIDDAAIDTITTAYLAARYGVPDPNSLRLLETRVRQLP